MILVTWFGTNRPQRKPKKSTRKRGNDYRYEPRRDLPSLDDPNATSPSTIAGLDQSPWEPHRRRSFTHPASTITTSTNLVEFRRVRDSSSRLDERRPIENVGTTAAAVSTSPRVRTSPIDCTAVPVDFMRKYRSDCPSIRLAAVSKFTVPPPDRR